jgi:hypothetical protein
MDGKRSPQSPSISRLTSQPETIPSCYRRTRHAEFKPHSERHPFALTKSFSTVSTRSGTDTLPKFSKFEMIFPYLSHNQ